MKKNLLKGKLTFFFLLACSALFAQPYIDPSSGLGQYGYVEKDASATNFLLNSGSYGNIYQLFARTYISSNILTYGSAISSCAGTNVSQTTFNYNFGTLSAGNTIYSSVHADICGGGNTYGGNANQTGFNERSFFVVDVAPTTNSLVSSACYTSANANVVLSFTIANGNTASQILNRFWITNDGTAIETTDIRNDAFALYYEPATGSETFNGNESSAVLYGDFGGNNGFNNEYGSNGLNISIPQNTTGGLRCYVVLRGTSAYLNASAKNKTVRVGVMADGISITPNRDSSYSKLRMDLTRSSASYITINDAVTPTFTQVAAICSGATLSALPTVSNNGYNGTWSPALNNTATTLYTFTPTAGQCATTATMTITVNPIGTPTFTQVPAICSGATLSALPTISNNSYAGTWSPALNNTATTLYTFTPNSGVCANATTMTITVNPNVTYYRDADNDTYGNPLVTTVSCTGVPVGYVANNTDCNDADGTKHASHPFYADGDGDGYGAGSLVSVCAVNSTTPPAGYVSNNTDCNDGNTNVYQTANLYTDADGDHYTVGSAAPVCYGATIPNGYSATSLGSDCNDADGAMHASFTFYLDADNDGYGVGNLVSVCAVNGTTPPDGHASNNTDCDDSDNAAHQTYTFYEDNDHDGYGAGALVPVCTANGTTAPFGYSLLNTDCDDQQVTVHPGASEIDFDGLDNDCNNIVDDNSRITTKLANSSCGATLAAIGSIIQIQPLAGQPITGYIVRVTNGSNVQTITKTTAYFNLREFAQYEYATTYTVDIQLIRNGVALGYYGATCLVSTPAILQEGGATAVNPSQCGTIIPTVKTLIYTTSLASVTGYRFRVSELNTQGTVVYSEVLERPYQWFSLSMLAQYRYNAEYRIEVAVKTTGAYSNYGNACNVFAPKVSMTNCGITVPLASTQVKSTQVTGATQYRFQLTKVSDLASTEIDRGYNYFTFGLVPGYTKGAEYLVRVAVLTSGGWSAFSDACEITAPGGTAPAPKVETAALDFNAVAHPNPFASDFEINVTTSSTEALQLRVYDMIGKVVESRDVKSSEIENLKVGNNYPAGVYNVVVTQGVNVKTLRVIKR